MSQAHVPIPGGPSEWPRRAGSARVDRPWWPSLPGDEAGEEIEEPEIARAPSGWYPDPPKLRYWTGERWTDEVRFAGPPSPSARASDVPAAYDVQPAKPFRAQFAPPASADFGSPSVAPSRPPTVAPTVAPSGPPAGSPGPIAWPPPPEPGVERVETASSPEQAVERSLWRELALFALISLLAMAVGGAVTALGIALTV